MAEAVKNLTWLNCEKKKHCLQRWTWYFFPVISEFRRLRQEEQECKASLGYRVNPLSSTKQRTRVPSNTNLYTRRQRQVDLFQFKAIFF